MKDSSIENGTIAAIATAGSEGCISIVRLSGPDALNITEKITRSTKKPTEAAANTVLYGHIVGSDGIDIDEVLLLILLPQKPILAKTWSKYKDMAGEYPPHESCGDA